MSFFKESKFGLNYPAGSRDEFSQYCLFSLSSHFERGMTLHLNKQKDAVCECFSKRIFSNVFLHYPLELDVVLHQTLIPLDSVEIYPVVLEKNLKCRQWVFFYYVF